MCEMTTAEQPPDNASDRSLLRVDADDWRDVRNNLLANAVWVVPGVAVVGLGLSWADAPGLVAAGVAAWTTVRLGRLGVEWTPILSRAAWFRLIRLRTRADAALYLRRQLLHQSSAAYRDAGVRFVVAEAAAAPSPALPVRTAPVPIPGAYEPALFMSVSDVMRSVLPNTSVVQALNATTESYRRAFEQLDTRGLVEAYTSTSAALKQLFPPALDSRVFPDLTGALGPMSQVYTSTHWPGMTSDTPLGLRDSSADSA
jgi:hypothetical protein